MTDKEKILALEVENVRLRDLLSGCVKRPCGNLCSDRFYYKCDECKSAYKSLTAQPPSEVMGKLKEVKDCIQEYEGISLQNLSKSETRAFPFAIKALAILKELGVE
jgi:hypothetical protein